MKKLFLTMAIFVFLISCNGKKKEVENEKKVDTSKTVEKKVEKKNAYVLVSDTGGVNDKSFNQSAWEGMQRAAKDFGVNVSYIESKQESDYRNNFETALDKKPSIVFSVGFLMGEITKQMAKENPDFNFAIVDFSYDKPTPNLTGIMFKAEQASFLVGYIAGKMTKTNKVGFVGGIKGFIIDQFEYGYLAGVKYANPKVQVMRQYADSFQDQAKGKSIAEGFYLNGADIVFHAAGGVGIGVFEAAKEQNKFAIGVDRDQNVLAPKNIITSATKKVGNAIYKIIKENENKAFVSGKNLEFSLKDNSVGIAKSSSKHVPKEILDQVEKIKSKIINGELTIPKNEKEYKDFEKNILNSK